MVQGYVKVVSSMLSRPFYLRQMAAKVGNHYKRFDLTSAERRISSLLGVVMLFGALSNGFKFAFRRCAALRIVGLKGGSRVLCMVF